MRARRRGLLPDTRRLRRHLPTAHNYPPS